MVRRSGVYILGVILLAAMGSSCTRYLGEQFPWSSSDQSASSGKTVRSNILRRDYAGSEACGKCHGEIYARFRRGPMHNMTRLPDSVGDRAPFDGRVFRFHEDSVVMEMRSSQRYLRVGSGRFGDKEFRVTKIIGGHHREDFAGVETSHATETNPDEIILPVSYMLGSGKLRYKGYSVMEPERPGLKPSAVWNRTCIFCHNTVPYLSTVLGALDGPESPGYQGESVEHWLPRAKRWTLAVTDTAGFLTELSNERKFLAGFDSDPRGQKHPAANPEDRKRELTAAFGETIETTRKHFGAKALLEVGIGCESCHGGSREHASDPNVKTSLEPRSPYLSLRKPSPDTGSGEQSKMRRHALQIDRVCARCHQVLFSGYPWTWEGRRRQDTLAGGAQINSGEARDLLLSKCSVTCTDCHDPHAHRDTVRLQTLEGPAGNAVCARCHAELVRPAALQAHAHHSPAGAGGLCINCHMPRKNMSLDSRLSRYHRVGSPDAVEKVEGDRPLECALCHADKTVGEMVDTMEAWWGKHYDRKAVTGLYGDWRAKSLEATLQLGKPHEQATALYLSGLGGDTSLVPLIVRQLTNPYPLVRYYADNALAALTGMASPLDLHRRDEQIQKDALEWMRSVQFPGTNRNKPDVQMERFPKDSLK